MDCANVCSRHFHYHKILRFSFRSLFCCCLFELTFSSPVSFVCFGDSSFFVVLIHYCFLTASVFHLFPLCFPSTFSSLVVEFHSVCFNVAVPMGVSCRLQSSLFGRGCPFHKLAVLTHPTCRFHLGCWHTRVPKLRQVPFYRNT